MLIEPVPVPEIFAMGIQPPEDHGTHFRVIVYDERTCQDDMRIMERVIVGRFIFPRPAFFMAVDVAAKTTSENKVVWIRR